MWNFSTNLCEFFLCLCTNLYLWWLYFTIYWRKSCSWRIILAINIKITYNAIHQRHLMTGLRREISTTMRLSWTSQKIFTIKKKFVYCMSLPIVWNFFFTMLLMSNFIFYSCLFLRLEEVIHEGVNQSQSYCIHHYIEHLV